jgi:hypothetical protein
VRLARGEGDRLGGEREPRRVDGGRVTPVLADPRKRGVFRERLRRLDVRVAAVNRGDASVRPVRVGVAREQQWRRERGDLNRHGKPDDGRETRPLPPKQRQSGRIRDQGERGAEEEGPGPGRVPDEQASLDRDERSVVDPRERRAGADERQRDAAGDEDH